MLFERAPAGAIIAGPLDLMSRDRQSVTRALWGNPRTSAVLASTAAPVAALGQRPASTGAVRRIAVAPPSGRCATVWAHVRLARAETLLAFVGTFVGAGLVGFEGPPALVVAVAASNMLLSSASMMFNDWHDVEEDRINRPDRPIPSGQVPRDRALVMSATLYVVALVVAVIAGLPFGLGAAAVIGLSIIYTWRLKAIPVLGHGVTALLSGYPLLCWMSVARFEDSVYLAFTAGYVVAGIGKEVVRTAADAPGDAAAGIRTVATLRGGRSANRIGAGVVAVALMVGWLPILLGDAGIAFAVALTLGTIAALMFGVPRLSGPPRESSRQLIFLARAIMVLLVLAVTVDLVRAGWSLF